MSNKNVKPPMWLLEDKEEAKIFRQILALDENEVIEKSDSILIAMLVDSIIDYREAKEKLKTQDVVIELQGDRGHARQTVNPYVSIKKDAKAQAISILKEIGYTTKSRLSINIIEGTSDELSPFEMAIKNRLAKKRGE